MDKREEIKGRIETLLSDIEARKEHPNAAPTFRDRASLLALEDIAREGLSSKDEDSLAESVMLLALLADAYGAMGRFAVSAVLYTEAISASARLYACFGKRLPHDGELLFRAVRAANFYVDDPCKELLRAASIYLGEEAQRILLDALRVRRSLRHDPVEMTERYLSVIDEVEELIEAKRTVYGMGSCHEVWQIKRSLLAERGVAWRSPAVLNPRVMFD